MEGQKRVLGFVETTAENKRVLTEFLRSLLGRGLDISEGIFVVIGGKKAGSMRSVEESRSRIPTKNGLAPVGGRAGVGGGVGL